MTGTADIVVHTHRDSVGARIGMWLFLFTELLLFGGMFLLYSVYRYKNPMDFHNAAAELNPMIGAFNTFILLTSSCTMALCISSLQKKNRKAAIVLLVVTIALGVFFLVNKYFEWGAKIHHGIYPNSPEMLQMYNHGEVLFFGLYFVMTGLHGLHVIAGIGVLAVMLYFITKRPTTKIWLDSTVLENAAGSRLALSSRGETQWKSSVLDKSVDGVAVTIRYKSGEREADEANIIKLENSGLYWHLVDIIWIFLFPLFYLIT